MRGLVSGGAGCTTNRPNGVGRPFTCTPSHWSPRQPYARRPPLIAGRCNSSESSSDAPSGSDAASSSDAQASAAVDSRAKAQLALVASTLVAQSKAVLLAKVTSYNEQLKELQAASDKNILWKAVNVWTERLLRRKIAFNMERLSSLLAIENSVQSCSLDSGCTFAVRAKPDPAAARRFQDGMASMTGLGLSGEPLIEKFQAMVTKSKQFEAEAEQLKRVLQQMELDMVVDKEARVDIPPLTWTVAAEAEELQEALSAAYAQAEKIPGAKVELSKKYSFVRSEEIDEQGLGSIVSAWLKRYDEGMAQAATNFSSRTPFIVAVGGIVSVALNTWLAGLIGGLLGLEPMQVHWDHLIPHSFSEAQALVLWTLPLVSVYSLLAFLREDGDTDKSKPAGPLVAAADTLQTSQRLLNYSLSSTPDDMRVQYFLSTLTCVASLAPWVYALQPACVMEVGGLWTFPTLPGIGAPASLLSVFTYPLTALVVAAIGGAYVYYLDVVYDLIDRGEKGDETKFIDQVFGPNPTPGTGEPALMFDPTTLYGVLERSPVIDVACLDDPKLAERIIRDSLSALKCDSSEVEGKVRDSLSQPPNVITMDFESAKRQAELAQQEQWVIPTAVAFTMFYLVMETLLTGEVTAPVITEVAAICAMDAISKPWKRYSMTIHVEMQSSSGVRLGKSKLGDLTVDDSNKS